MWLFCVCGIEMGRECVEEQMKKELVAAAFAARAQSYAPYSDFCVGAAVLTESGHIYQGCNVENASYGATVCAERTAALQAVFHGDRVFTAIAIVGGERNAETLGYAYPCGICRQFLREFAAPHMKVYVAASLDEIVETTLEELLPHAFGPQSLQG